DFFERYMFIVDFPVYLNGEPKEFSLHHDGGDGNPLQGMEFEGQTFSVKDASYNLMLNFEFSSAFKVWTYSHDTYSRMNTDDYQSRYQAINMVFIPNEKEFKISLKLKLGSGN
nr:hypothetical protein [Candidatus Sigynarchaeota archaeon]